MPRILLAITLITLIASLALYLAHRLAKGDPRVDCWSGWDRDDELAAEREYLAEIERPSPISLEQEGA